MKTLSVSDRKEWHEWLSDNHNIAKEIWLVYYKKNSGIVSLDYESSVEEALCFGWVDGLIKKLDGERYARKFTPRKANSNWSLSNITRVKSLMKRGLMEKAGLEKVQQAKKSGKWDNPVVQPTLSYKMTPQFQESLEANPLANEVFHGLSRSHQKEYLGWIESAKRQETKMKRINRAIQLLTDKKKLGLK